MKTSSLAHSAYVALRDEIIDGVLAPGSTLVQEQLALRLGLSRTPLREALHRLVHEGLVDLASGGGYLVSDLSGQTIADVHQVRESLELLALRSAIGRHGPLEIARLVVLVEEMAAAAADDAAAQFELNRQFHLALVEPCANDFLLQTLTQLWEHPVNRQITRSYVGADAANVVHMVDEHRAIIDALSSGDTDAVLALASAHLRTGYDDAAKATVP